MEELTALQQGYYYLSKHQFDEAKQHFGSLVTEKCDDPHPYIGLLLAENGLERDGGRWELGNIITSPAVKAAIGYEQMDYYFPVKIKV